MERSDLDPCCCGHPRLEHEPTDRPDNPPGELFCDRCCGKGDTSWHDFKLDNLKYLEMLSKEKEVADLK
jgi:hypothetical protein